MRILLLGSGGREHALAWKIVASPLCRKLWCAPGNAGIAREAECVALDIADTAQVVAFCKSNNVDFVVVGPEAPLVAGIVDALEAAQIKTFGPTRAAARLEASKGFTKDLCRDHHIPTAAYERFRDATAARRYVRDRGAPIVVKADGLAAGKGVMVAPTPDEATAFIERVMEKKEFGAAGDMVLLEEALEGHELSYIVLTDGQHVLPMAPTQDHKRALDGDHGPNTGGMGAFSIDSLLPSELGASIQHSIVQPTIAGLASESLAYRGFLYFGLMVTAEGPKVLEFNCRMGDPEAQALVMRMDFDLATALLSVAEGKLDPVAAKWNPAASACVVMASGGYPGEFAVGKKIEGLALDGGEAEVFHAGTKREDSICYTCSGRVLAVAAAGRDLSQAMRLAYEAAAKIRFEGVHYRKDIGAKALASPQDAGA
ncbi:MAG: phosphoribosylamine--glycine ligase [Proteobacteria bacterium]|nr:phosphoribosylamine--glycine ligase [Pseudomonadota bacterium]